MTPPAIKQVYPYYDRINAGNPDLYKYCPRCKGNLACTDRGHHDRLTCKKCGFVFYKAPVPSIRLLIVEGGHMLLGQRASGPFTGKWALPEGFIEYDEDFLSAAIREARQETGLEIEIAGILNVVSAFLPQQHFISLFLLAHPVGGDIHLGDDLLALDWFDLADPLPEMAFAEEMDTIHHYTGRCVALPVDASYNWGKPEP